MNSEEKHWLFGSCRGVYSLYYPSLGIIVYPIVEISSGMIVFFVTHKQINIILRYLNWFEQVHMEQLHQLH